MQKIDFWNQLYASNKCLFGDQANSLLLNHYQKLPPHAKVLNIGDGEGINSIFLAKQNYHVISLDNSIVAQQKAQENSYTANTVFECITSDILEWETFPNQFDMITLFYVHIPEVNKQPLAAKINALLKTNGLFLFECFHKRHLKVSDIGPQDEEMLYDEQELNALYGQFTLVEMNVKYAKSVHQAHGDKLGCSLQFVGLKN